MIEQRKDVNGLEVDADAEFVKETPPLGTKARKIVMGYEDEIHGELGKLTNIQITRSEVEILVAHYVREYWDINFHCTVNECSGSWEIRHMGYSLKRIEDFVEAGAISHDRAKKLSADYYDKFDWNMGRKNTEDLDAEMERILDAITENEEEQNEWLASQ